MKAQPFLKWAGGKRQLLSEIAKHIPPRINTYYEPFVGGGAVFFDLYNKKLFKKAQLSDLNKDLINTYMAIQKLLPAVITRLKNMPYEQDFYYKTRAQDPNNMSPSGEAARMIYLNRTCFNGLYRVNKKGKFNVPMGRYKNPKILDAALLKAVSAALKKVTISHLDFENAVVGADETSFIYFDPPYLPLSETSSFTAYDACGFCYDEQVRLARLMFSLKELNIRALLSNSDTPETRKLYKGLEIHTVFAKRRINSKGDKRGKVTELLVRTY
jgi:DNA adenine methylase